MGAGTTAAGFLGVFVLFGVSLFPDWFVEGLAVGTPAWWARAILVTLPPLACWLSIFFAVFGGYLGGRTGGRLRGRSAGSAR